MEQGSEPVGDLDDVYQEEADRVIPDFATVPVEVRGPVQSQSLPAVSGGMRVYVMSATDSPKRVGGSDPRRRVMRLICPEDMYVGVDQNSVVSQVAARWPSLVPLELTHSDEVWVRPTADTYVSVISENWAS